MEPRIIPALLLQDRAFVKTVRFDDPTYVGDPVNVLSIFNHFEVDEILLIDIGAARARRPTDDALLRELAEECFIPLAYGGGLEAIDDIERVLRIGYEKVVMNTAMHSHPSVVRSAADAFGSQAIVAAVDVRGAGADARAVVRAGSVDTGCTPLDWARQVEQLGVGELLVTSVDREGTMEGFDLDLVATLADAVSIPVIAHGGAGKRNHLSEAVHAGRSSAVAAGSLFVFQGKARSVLINYPTRAQITKLLG